jgi:hypothetical protein
MWLCYQGGWVDGGGCVVMREWVDEEWVVCHVWKERGCQHSGLQGHQETPLQDKDIWSLPPSVCPVFVRP